MFRNRDRRPPHPSCVMSGRGPDHHLTLPLMNARSFHSFTLAIGSAPICAPKDLAKKPSHSLGFG
jgi:hypothetical protein